MKKMMMMLRREGYRWLGCVRRWESKRMKRGFGIEGVGRGQEDLGERRERVELRSGRGDGRVKWKEQETYTGVGKGVVRKKERWVGGDGKSDEKGKGEQTIMIEEMKG